MNTVLNAQSDPIFEHVTTNNVTVKTIITENPQRCALCGSEAKSLYIYTFKLFFCDPCFNFALSCKN